MIWQCRRCKRIKRFGEWIEVPRDIEGLLPRLKIVHVLCGGDKCLTKDVQ